MHAGGLVRIAHVAAAAIVVAGALVSAARPSPARRYEWAFWAAALVLVVTGIGNVATSGSLDAGPRGVAFRVKLASILALVLLSAARVFALTSDAPERALRVAYATTALLAGATLALGLVVAHA